MSADRSPARLLPHRSQQSVPPLSYWDGQLGCRVGQGRLGLSSGAVLGPEPPRAFTTNSPVASTGEKPGPRSSQALRPSSLTPTRPSPPPMARPWGMPWSGTDRQRPCAGCQRQRCLKALPGPPLLSHHRRTIICFCIQLSPKVPGSRGIMSRIVTHKTWHGSSSIGCCITARQHPMSRGQSAGRECTASTRR